MLFEKMPNNTPAPESAGSIENADLNLDIGAEMFTLEEEAGKLAREVEALQAKGIDDDVDEKKKNDIFTQVRKITYAFTALAAIPLVASVLQPEKAKEINEAMSNMGKLINNNIPEVLTVLGVIIAASSIYAVRLEIENSKNRALCKKMFQTMVKKTEANNWGDLDIDLDHFVAQLQNTVFSSYESEKKEKRLFRDKLLAIKEPLEAKPELDNPNTLLKLNNLISSLDH